MNRAERRRIEREIEKIQPDPGVGKGWRLTPSGKFFYEKGIPLKKCRKYPVRELTNPVDIDTLIEESNKKQKEFGIIVPED